MANEPLKTGRFPCTGDVCRREAVPADVKISRRDFFKLGRQKALGFSAATGTDKEIGPFGIVRIHADRCTGCGLCGLNCPTGALTFSTDGVKDSYRILFLSDHCTGCGACRKSCPERAISVEKTLQVGEPEPSAAPLVEHHFSSCRECGAPVFPRAMVDHLKARLSAVGATAWAVDLCPACRAKSLLLSGHGMEDRSNEITLESHE